MVAMPGIRFGRCLVVALVVALVFFTEADLMFYSSKSLIVKTTLKSFEIIFFGKS